MSEATIARLRLFLIESPIKMARLQGVKTIRTAKADTTGSDVQVVSSPDGGN